MSTLPQGEAEKSQDLQSTTLIIVPLVAFDRKNYRLGMGGGYYDRFIAHLHTSGQYPFLLGVAFDEQFCDHLPLDPWDQPLNAVSTASSSDSIRSA
jgi:5-formyltetrahydrofolate cyclo-ligase